MKDSGCDNLIVISDDNESEKYCPKVIELELSDCLSDREEELSKG